MAGLGRTRIRPVSSGSPSAVSTYVRRPRHVHTMRQKFESEDEEAGLAAAAEATSETALLHDRDAMASGRHADVQPAYHEPEVV